MVKLGRCTAVVALALTACGGPPPQPLPITPPGEAAGAAVVRRPLPDSAAPSAVGASPINPPATPALTVIVPPGSLYVCVNEVGSALRQTAIEFAPSVAKLCGAHPEMGACQYERDACRRSGGRVFAADGTEITRSIEDEYDKRVMRIRLRSN